MRHFEISATVKSGFPVVVSGYVIPADHLTGQAAYLSDLDIRTIQGSSTGFLKLTATDLAKLEDDVWSILLSGSL